MTEEWQQQKMEQFKEQFDELLINVRNEAIVQAANLYVFGRQALLAGIGMGALTIEAAQSLVQRAVERGEIAETDAQAMLERMRQDGLGKASDAEARVPSLTDQAAVALADSASTILRALNLHSTEQ
jgi:polyhydroxyalkanoate synthesis regulator phasin